MRCVARYAVTPVTPNGRAVGRRVTLWVAGSMVSSANERWGLSSGSGVESKTSASVGEPGSGRRSTRTARRDPAGEYARLGPECLCLDVSKLRPNPTNRWVYPRSWRFSSKSPRFTTDRRASAPVVPCPGVLRIFDEELLGVYGEHHLHRAVRVEFFDGSNRLA